MREAMSHRGPDGVGLWVAQDQSIGLGHSRLAIIDLSPAAGQPMSSDDDRFHLVFNGMIYNHAALRKELDALQGRAWKTDHSDTEVILRAWQCWGVDCIHRFHGMFSIAVWDSQQKKLWLVRDRLGIKPLYYSIDQFGLRFASEVQALVRVHPALCRMNPAALARFLHFGYIPGQETAFAEVQRVMPGCWICVEEDGSRTVRRYWDILEHGQNRYATAEDHVEEVRALLAQSIAEHNLSDVPLGLLLSGGVDSSAIAALSIAEAGRPLPSFSIGYDGEFPSCPDETVYARAAAAMAGTEYHQKTVAPEEFEATVAPLAAAMAEPFAMYHVPLYAVAGLARAKGVRVLHGGEGADEIFLGYHLFQRGLEHEAQRRFSPFESCFRQASSRFIPLQAAKLSWVLPTFTGTREGLNLRRLKSVLGPELSRAIRNTPVLDSVGTLYGEFREKCHEGSMQQWMSYVDMHMRLSSSLLPKWDIVTMQHGIECRVPFLDHRIVEKGFSIPGELKMRAGQSKIVLKRAVRDLVPDQVVRRKKQGLSTPLLEWFNAGLGSRMLQTTLDFSRRTDLLVAQQVQEIFSSDPNRAWYLYTFAVWHKQYFGT